MTQDHSALDQQQRALVEALVLGRPVPGGFDADRIDAAVHALLNKRAGEVAEAWPLLKHGMGERWYSEFAQWATGRPKTTSFSDGLAFAQSLTAEGRFPAIAEPELSQALRSASRGRLIRLLRR